MADNGIDGAAAGNNEDTGNSGEGCFPAIRNSILGVTWEQVRSFMTSFLALPKESTCALSSPQVCAENMPWVNFDTYMSSQLHKLDHKDGVALDFIEDLKVSQ